MGFTVLEKRGACAGSVGCTDLAHGAHEVEHVGEVVVGDELAAEGPRLEHPVERPPRVVLADLAGAGLVDGAIRVVGRDVVLFGVGGE